jgi:hypothetical protein
MAVQPIADAEAPAFAHGDTAEKPIPVPKARSASDRAAATNAPAMTAPHETPDECASFLPEVSAKPVWERAADEDIGCSMQLLSLFLRDLNLARGG